MTSSVFSTWMRLVDVNVSPNPGNQDVIIMNAPFPPALTPFYKVYQGQPLPKTLKVLVPGCIAFRITRTDDKTLVIESALANIFSSDQNSPMHFSHLCMAFNDLFLGDQSKKGDKFAVRNLTIEVLAVDGRRLPTEVSFRFADSLNDPNLYWLQFNWRTFSYQRFEVPKIGQTVAIPGPGYVTFGDAIRYIFAGASGR